MRYTLLFLFLALSLSLSAMVHVPATVCGEWPAYYGVSDTLPPVIGHVTTADGNHTTEVRGYWVFNQEAEEWQPVGEPLTVGIPKPNFTPKLYPDFTRDTSTPVFVDVSKIGTITGIWDGDTYSIQLAEKTRIRIFAVDCPETKTPYVTTTQPYGRMVEDSVRALLINKKVKHRVYGVDKYGRLLTGLTLDKKDVGLILLEKGWGWYYPSIDPDGPQLSKTNQRKYAAAQRRAQKAKRGLWAGYTDKDGNWVAPIEPWKWRTINSPSISQQ